MRSISRVAGVSINTVTKLLVDAGNVCQEYHDEHVRGVRAQRIHCDKIWSFYCANQRAVPTTNKAPDGAGDTWTWTALDADNKLIVSWLVGGRDAEYASAFMRDVADRLATDGHGTYLQALEGAFGADADFTQLVKLYGQPPEAEKRYSPRKPPDKHHISTSFVERQDLSLRTHMRRSTQLTKASSKRVENHCHALALYFVWHNFCRIHKPLTVTPAMAASVTDTLRDMKWIVSLIDARAPKPGPRGSYKKKNSN